MDATRRASLTSGLPTHHSRRGLLGGTVAAALATPASVVARQDSLNQPPVISVDKNVPYGAAESSELLLDVYRPPTRDDPRPAVLLFHASFGSRTTMADPATKLAEAGYIAFAIEFRVYNPMDGNNSWPAQLDDAQRAVRWVRANAATYGVDPERVASYGYSYGATLASLLGVRDVRDDSDPALSGISSRVNCVVTLAGESDLATIPPPTDLDQQDLADWLGGTPEEIPEVYRDVSPVTWVNAETVPFLIVHSADDDTVAVEHALRLIEALREAEVDAVYVAFAEGNHDRPAFWRETGRGP